MMRGTRSCACFLHTLGLTRGRQHMTHYVYASRMGNSLHLEWLFVVVDE